MTYSKRTVEEKQAEWKLEQMIDKVMFVLAMIAMVGILILVVYNVTFFIK